MKYILFIFLIFSLTGLCQTFSEVQKIVASDRNTNDWFGRDVSISGNYAIVGADREDHDLLGNNYILDSGSAYIFERDSLGSWTQVQKLIASDRADISDYFGQSVSISGSYAIVGAFGNDEDELGGDSLTEAGSAYIFERNGSGVWIEVQKIVASDRESIDWFGYAVSISNDFAIINARYEDEDSLGNNSVTDAGSVYIFERNGLGVWIETQKIVASDRGINDQFGFDLSIDGNYMVIGAYQEDEDVSSSNTMNSSGSAYIFERNSGVWSEVQKVVASDRKSFDYFGISVSISGDYFIVGASGEDEDEFGLNTAFSAGSAYIFERNGVGIWNEVKKIVASDRQSNDNFGSSVGISGNYAIVSAPYQNYDSNGNNFITNAGASYIYERNGVGVWAETQKIVSSDRGFADRLGLVAISNYYIIIGVLYENEDEFGANTLTSAGSSYFFETCPVIDTSTILVGSIISSNQNGASYQWIDCGNGFIPIVGETNQSYVATTVGSYAVVVNINGCSDTSACVNIIITGLGNLNKNSFNLFPNPTSDQLIISSGININKITIYNLTGELMHSLHNPGTHISVFTLPSGIYFLKFETEEGIITKKFIKQ